MYIKQSSYYGSFSGAVAQHNPTEAEKNQISRWADAASNGDHNAYLSAINAMKSVTPWNEDSGFFSTISGGGYYSYNKISEMMSTTIAERHPEWLTVTGTVVGTALDIATAGQVSQQTKNNITDSAVNTGGGIINTVVDAGGGASLEARKKLCEALPFKKWNPDTLSCEGDVPWTLILVSATIIVGGISSIYLFGPAIRGLSKRVGVKVQPTTSSRRKRK